MPMHILLPLVGLVVLAGGIAALVGAVIRWRREKRAARTYVSVQGRIIKRYIPPGSSTRNDGVSYTIDFATGDGKTARFETDSVGVTPRNVGDVVEVLHDPADPEKAIVRGGERLAAYLLTIAGVIFTLIGLLISL